MGKLTGYDLSRQWFDFAFENPEKISPNHTALYFFACENQNRLGGVKKFGLPTEMAKSAIGIKSYNTYAKTFNDLVAWGFFELIEKSKNQYSCNIIAISKFDKALDKALDKAMIKHTSKHLTKQQYSTGESIDSISKPITINIKPITIEHRMDDFKKSLTPYIDKYGVDMINNFFLHFSQKNNNAKKMHFEKQQTFDLSKRLAMWSTRDYGSKSIVSKKQKDIPTDDALALFEAQMNK